MAVDVCIDDDDVGGDGVGIGVAGLLPPPPPPPLAGVARPVSSIYYIINMNFRSIFAYANLFFFLQEFSNFSFINYKLYNNILIQEVVVFQEALQVSLLLILLLVC